MRIVMDLQGAQTSSRFRGIGRYTLSLCRAILRKNTDHQIFIALSNLFPDTIDFIRAEFKDLIPQEQIVIFELKGPTRAEGSGNQKNRQISEYLRESFIHNLNPDIIFITSLFEGYEDDAVLSVDLINSNAKTVVIGYDLIPYYNPDTYLNHNMKYKDFYWNRLGSMKRADHIFSISKSSTEEFKTSINFSESRVHNVYAGCDDCFKVLELSPDQQESVKNKLNIKRPFMMYAGGADVRKNIDRMIVSYSMIPKDLRSQHQFVLVGKLHPDHIGHIKSIAHHHSLDEDEILLPGYVTDEDLAILYNICKTFVFPSWHEGFGLPVLEAMSCGAAVICSNTSSLPELMDHPAALFDPRSERAIADAMIRVLSNDQLREELKAYGLQRATLYTWENAAERAWAAFNYIHAQPKAPQSISGPPAKRGRLAYVSPLAPQVSGIADYSAELLPELFVYYNIDIISPLNRIDDPWISANCPLRTPNWLRDNAHLYDRVLYHMGNSTDHDYMIGLMADVPGVMVLHDFFICHLIAMREANHPHSWRNELYKSHGYKAILDFVNAENKWDIPWIYPANLSVIENALGVIVHSQNSKTLAHSWYGAEMGRNWHTVPHLRKPPTITETKAEARKALAIPDDALVVVSMGHLGPSKLNDRLLHAWTTTNTFRTINAVLIFVGKNDEGSYGTDLENMIDKTGFNNRIKITGRVTTRDYNLYLRAADIGVQLRTKSRGETSGAVLDCMNYGLPVIANKNGSLAELPQSSVILLDDEFADHDLAQTLDDLLKSPEKRQIMGDNGQMTVRTIHSPESCAKLYGTAIEQSYADSVNHPMFLNSHFSSNGDVALTTDDYQDIADLIAVNDRRKTSVRQIFIDISELVHQDIRTGIQRVTRSILISLLKSPPAGFRIEPVYALMDRPGYHYAHTYTLNLLGADLREARDLPIETYPGDVFIGLDLHSGVVMAQIPTLDYMHNRGVSIHFVVYDILPVLLPDVFPPGSDWGHEQWMKTISRYDGVACISNAVANEMRDWLNSQPITRHRPLQIGWFGLGADLESSLPTRGLPADSSNLLGLLAKKPTFLMVGTVEPRKGYLQSVQAFTKLWKAGEDINLVIVGKEGWVGLADSDRRTIPETVQTLRNHPELGNHLHWLEGISDEYLDLIYKNSTCLLYASQGEGFGLPLIEAAQYGMPVLCRDLPVFREIAGDHADYFVASFPAQLAEAVQAWLVNFKAGHHKTLANMPYLNWNQATEQLLSTVLTGEKSYQWGGLPKHK